MIVRKGAIMSENLLKAKIYKTSYFKSGIAFLFFGFGVFVFSMFFMAHDGIKGFFSGIVVLVGILYLSRTIRSLFFRFYLSIDKNGIDLCGKKISWSEIQDIHIDSMQGDFIHGYTITVTYGEKNRKPLLYYYDKRQVYQSLRLFSFQLNASSWEIYKRLKAFHEKYGMRNNTA